MVPDRGWDWGCEDAGGSSAPASGAGAAGVPAAGETAPFCPPPGSCFPRCFPCRSHKQRDPPSKFNPHQQQSHRQNRAALLGDRSGLEVAVHTCACVCVRVHVCARVWVCRSLWRSCPQLRGPQCSPKTRWFLGALQPTKPCQEPEVTGQGGDVPGWVSPSPSHAPSSLRAGIPRSAHAT